jgi:son of sevenless-like protein
MSDIEKLVEENNKLQLQVYLLLQNKSSLQYKIQILDEEAQFLKNTLQLNIRKYVDEWAQQYQRRTNALLQEFEFLRNDELVFLNPKIDNKELPYGYHNVEKPLLDQIARCKEEIQRLQLQYDSFVENEHAQLKNSYYELLGEHEATQSKLLQVNDKCDTLKRENFKLTQQLKLTTTTTTSTTSTTNNSNNSNNNNESDSDSDSDDDVSTDPEQQQSRNSTDRERDAPQKMDLDDQIISLKDRRKRVPSVISKNGSPVAVVPAVKQIATASSFRNSVRASSPSSPTSIGRKFANGDKKVVQTGKYFEKSKTGTIFVDYELSMTKTSGTSSAVKASIVVTDKFHMEPVDCLVVSNTDELDCSSDRDARYAKLLNSLTKDQSILNQCQEYLSEEQTDLEKKMKKKHKLSAGAVFCGQLEEQYHVIHVVVSPTTLKSVTSNDEPLNKLRINQDPVYKKLNPAIKNVLEAADSIGCTSIAFCPLLYNGIGQYSTHDSDWMVACRCMFASVCEYYAENKISTNLMDIRICLNSTEQAQQIKPVLNKDFSVYIAKNEGKVKDSIQRTLSNLSLESNQSGEKNSSSPLSSPSITNNNNHNSSRRELVEKIEPKDPALYYTVDYTTLTYTPEDDTKDTIEFMEDSLNVTSDSSENQLVSETPVDIKCATLSKLVERVTYHTTYDNAYLYAFLLTYRSFTTPQELLDRLVQRYFIPPPKKEGLTHMEFAIWHDQVLNKIRLRVSQLIKKWIENHYYDFENDEDLVHKVMEFSDMMEKTQGEVYATQIKRALKKQQSSTSQRQIVTFDKDDTSVPKSLYPKKYSLTDPSKQMLELLEWPSAELARQITLIEYEMFHGIQPKECLNQSWNKSNREEKAPHVFRMINWFNTVSRWVATCVVKEDNPKQRKLVLTKMIHLAEACADLNNYNAIFEIVSGLQNAAVHRLRKTWDSLNATTKKSFDKLYEIISRDNNYRNIRRAILDVRPPCIPYIGVFLTDLTFIEDGNPDVLNGKTNFIKRRKLAMLIRDIQTYQQTPYKLHHITPLQEQLRRIDGISEDTLYERSLIIEPRAKKV